MTFIAKKAPIPSAAPMSPASGPSFAPPATAWAIEQPVQQKRRAAEPVGRPQ
jgi:hypothetical protein